MRCFNSPGSPRRPMDSAADTPKGVGFPIRKSPDQRSLPSPRSLSQGATSFIASQCQGIHQMPFLRLRTLKTHAQGQTRTQASALAKKSRFGLRQFQAISFQPSAKNQTPRSPSKPSDASNNRPTPIAGCQKPIHNVKEPETRDQMSGIGHQMKDAGWDIRSRNASRPADRRMPKLVEPIGIEPTTSCVQSRRSPN